MRRLESGDHGVVRSAAATGSESDRAASAQTRGSALGQTKVRNAFVWPKVKPLVWALAAPFLAAGASTLAPPAFEAFALIQVGAWLGVEVG